MKTVDSKIIIKISKDAAVEKVGDLVIPIGNKGVETAIVECVGSKITDISTGDKLYILPGAGHKFTHNGVEYRLISIPDIIAIV